MTQQHGTHASMEVQGEGTVKEKQQNAAGGFRFERIFKNLPTFVLKQQVANEIGHLMTSNPKRLESTIPAGYTYFGQFVDHDITRDTTEESDRPHPDRDLVQARLTIPRSGQHVRQCIGQQSKPFHRWCSFPHRYHIGDTKPTLCHECRSRHSVRYPTTSCHVRHASSSFNS